MRTAWVHLLWRETICAANVVIFEMEVGIIAQLQESYPFFSLKADIRRICLAGDPLVYVVYKLEFSLCL